HVVIDNVAGGELAARHLVELGHRRIAFVGDAPTRVAWPAGGHRRQGYERALLDAGIEPEPQLRRLVEHGRPQARAAAAELLALPDPPTAIFAESDTQALGVLDA